MARHRLPVALLATGVLSGALLVSPPASTASATRTSSQRGYPWKRRAAAARHFAQHRIGTVSFAIVGEHGNLRGYKPRREFHSASVVKVMLMLSYLRRPSVRNRPLNAHDKSLLHPMITRSDNTTATEIYDIVGNAGLNRLARAAQMSDFHPNVVWGLTLIAARDMSEFMYRIRRYIPGRHRRYALHLLSHIVSYQRWGVPEAKPRGWRVYFKGGFIPAADGWRINQVALLRRGSRKLGLAVLTHGNPTLQYGAKTVQGVTARLLRKYNKLTAGHRPRLLAVGG
jgi:beta-lactamase class A